MQPRQVEVPVFQLDLMATPSPAEDLRHVLNKIDAKGLVGLVTALVIVYACSVAIYNLYFSPLAGFPGPKIAAATGYYEFYHDFFKKGNYIFEIEAMHNKYGSLTRQCPMIDCLLNDVIQVLSSASTHMNCLSTIPTSTTNSTCQQVYDERTTGVISGKGLTLMVSESDQATERLCFPWKLRAFD